MLCPNTHPFAQGRTGAHSSFSANVLCWTRARPPRGNIPRLWFYLEKIQFLHSLVHLCAGSVTQNHPLLQLDKAPRWKWKNKMNDHNWAHSPLLKGFPYFPLPAHLQLLLSNPSWEQRCGQARQWMFYHPPRAVQLGYDAGDFVPSSFGISAETLGRVSVLFQIKFHLLPAVPALGPGLIGPWYTLGAMAEPMWSHGSSCCKPRGAHTTLREHGTRGQSPALMLSWAKSFSFYCCLAGSEDSWGEKHNKSSAGGSLALCSGEPGQEVTSPGDGTHSTFYPNS